MNEYIHYKCKICDKSFILFLNEVEHSEEKSMYLACPHDSRHKKENICVVDRYSNMKECMEKQRIYKRDGRVIKQID